MDIDISRLNQPIHLTHILELYNFRFLTQLTKILLYFVLLSHLCSFQKISRSYLSSILFNVYMNPIDLSLICYDFNYNFYADDVNLFAHNKNLELAISILDKALSTLSDVLFYSFY